MDALNARQTDALTDLINIAFGLVLDPFGRRAILTSGGHFEKLRL